MSSIWPLTSLLILALEFIYKTKTVMAVVKSPDQIRFFFIYKVECLKLTVYDITILLVVAHIIPYILIINLTLYDYLIKLTKYTFCLL